MHVVAATHGHCFDGLCSAVLFTRLMQARHPGADVRYRACGYGVNQQKPTPQMFDGVENAILDYRFYATAPLTWYFDHHKTAFATEEDRLEFERRRPEGRFFFDPGYTSCAKLIADVGVERLGLNLDGLEPLVRWADRVDSAAFESAEDAIDRSQPVMQLVTVIEHHGDDHFLKKWVPELLRQPIEDVASSERIKKRFRPLGEMHERFIERVRRTARRHGRVVFVDMTDEAVETVGKFATYALFPECAYSVVVGRMKTGVKVSVGYNPWSAQPRDADISAICARHGGGGHPAVGGMAFPLAELDRAKEIARAVVSELDG